MTDFLKDAIADRLGRWTAGFAAVLATCALGLAGCAHTAPPPQSQSGSGVTVYGTVDAGVSRTGR